jgi:cytochrome c-type biogenesis protein
MDAESLRLALSGIGPEALWIGLLAGFVFSFNPVALAAIPVSLAYVTASRSTRQAMVHGGLFVLGMIVTHVGLGLAAALGGDWSRQLLGRGWGLVLGPLLIALGLIWPGWVRLPLPALRLRAKPVTGAWGAFALGRAVPVLLGAIGVGWLENLSGMRRFHGTFEVAGGAMLILSGLYMLNAYFAVVPGLAS